MPRLKLRKKTDIQEKTRKEYFETKNGKLYCGDVLSILKEMPSESIQCCITSPPYWGLRDYNTATWDGGDINCKHDFSQGGRNPETSRKQLTNKGTTLHQYRNICPKCGAIRIDQQLGLEKTPEEYVSKMVEIFREVKRVLKKDGTLWLNLGSSYAGGTETKGFKPKDLVPIPWMVAMALQQDGWYLRQDIIWHKTNPMPESVTDRCTKSHEYIFLMSKSSRYYYDNEAIKEPSIDKESYTGRKPRNAAQMDSMDPGNYKFHGSVDNNGKLRWGQIYEMRNKRSVWTVNTTPFKEAHFATFPLALILPCILAGTAENDIVLDPFMGAGTVGVVCTQQRRKWIGIELNEEYCWLSRRRIIVANPKPRKQYNLICQD